MIYIIMIQRMIGKQEAWFTIHSDLINLMNRIHPELQKDFEMV